MDITLTRVESTPDGVFSDVTTFDNQYICIAVEHNYQQSDGSFKPKMPAGVYTCKRRLSPHFGFELFQIMNVPGCNFIEIHPGNWGQIDSDGCVILGLAKAPSSKGEMVTNSKTAFNQFMAFHYGVDEFQLTVI